MTTQTLSESASALAAARPAEDATTELLRALQRAARGGLSFDLILSRRWHSNTFDGSRHQVRLRTDEDTAALLVATMDTRRFRMRGHILADIALVASEQDEDGTRLTLEALTVEDR